MGLFKQNPGLRSNDGHLRREQGSSALLTRGAAVEIAPYDIRVNAVAAVSPETPLFAASLERQDEPSEWRDAFESDIPQPASERPKR